MTDTWALVLAAVVLCSVPGGVFLQQDGGLQCEFLDNVYYDCIHISFTSVPENIPGSVTVLHLDRNNLTVLRNNELLNKGGANIEQLFLSSNSIAELEDEAFNGLTNLSVIDLFHNNITVFNKDIISGNLHMTKLILSDNPIKLPDSETEHLLNSASLASLDLMSCNLSRISDGLFRGLPNLRELHLAQNRLTTVNWVALDNLNILARVDFTRNQILQLPCEAEMVVPLSELNDLHPEIDRVNTPTSNSTKIFSIFANPLACDCCLSFVTYWMEQKSWYIWGDCRNGGAGPDIRTPEVLKQCYITIREDHNGTVGELH